MASPSRSGSGARKILSAFLAAVFNSCKILPLPLIVMYSGSKLFSISTPSFFLGRSLRWPTEAFIIKSLPTIFFSVLTLVGDSTINKDLPISPHSINFASQLEKYIGSLNLINNAHKFDKIV